MNHKLICLLVCILVCFKNNQLGAKTAYYEYYTIVNHAEEAFVNNSIDSSYRLYDAAFKTFDKPFVKDIYVASQIAFWHGDTAVFLHYLQIAFNNGMPRECVDIAPILKNLKDNPLLIGKINELYKHRQHSVINEKLKEDIYTIRHRETIAHDLLNGPYNKENVVNMKKVNNENVTAIIRYLDEGIWPSEKLIGIYTDEDYQSFLNKHNYKEKSDDVPTIGGMKLTPIPSSYALYNEAAYVPLLHDPCRFDELRVKLMKMVKEGLLHPGDYALFEEWSYHANRIDEKYTTLCPTLVKKPLYNILGDLKVTDENGIAQVNRNRKEIFLQKYDVDVRKKELEQKYGFRFFFGFFKSR